jgi:hypothetical protein
MEDGERFLWKNGDGQGCRATIKKNDIERGD